MARGAEESDIIIAADMTIVRTLEGYAVLRCRLYGNKTPHVKQDIGCLPGLVLHSVVGQHNANSPKAWPACSQVAMASDQSPQIDAESSRFESHFCLHKRPICGQRTMPLRHHVMLQFLLRSSTNGLVFGTRLQSMCIWPTRSDKSPASCPLMQHNSERGLDYKSSESKRFPLASIYLPASQ